MSIPPSGRPLVSVICPRINQPRLRAKSISGVWHHDGMQAIPPVKAVMTPFPYHVEIDAPLERARAMMREHSIGHLPVMEQGSLVGILRIRDLQSPAATGDGVRVREICSAEPPYVVGLSEPLDRLLLRMAEQGFDAALVVKDDKLAGIFTVSDVCEQFGMLLRKLFPPKGDDAA